MFRHHSRHALHAFVRIAAVSVLVACAPLAYAQQGNTALIVGTVVDGTEAPVPGATVQLTHLATNSTSDVITDERGQYRTPPLRIGEYEVSVGLPGFKRFTQRGVILNIGDVRKLDAKLELGDLAETITVQAETPLLGTADSTVGTVITNKQIKELPLNGRDYLQLAALSAGTAPSTDGLGGVSIGGQRGSQVAFLLDGQDNNNQQISTGRMSGQKEVLKPSVDAIQEFKVVTNGYSAEYGRSSSGVVSVALKSGTNRLSGTAYEFFRDDALDARNFFATEKPPFQRNQFGGAAGFPLVRNRTFFFGDFEAGVIRNSETTVSTLPSAAQRAGTFATTIIDPLTGQPFPGNQIPASRVDSIAAKALAYLPLPQTGAATNNFVYNSPNNQDVRRGDFRIDHTLSSRQNVYFRYGYSKTSDGASPQLPADTSGNFYTSGAPETSVSKSWVAVHNSVWSPTVISSVRLGWNNIAWDQHFPSQSLTGLGVPGVDETNPGFSQLVVTGYRSFGVTNIPNSDASTNTQLSGDLTITRGPHTIKTGVQAYWLRTLFLSSQRSSGIFNFNGQYTGNPFADYLLGYSSSASLSRWAQLDFRAPYTHFFAQDDWRIGRRLTLNLGLRYELSPPAVDRNDAIANFDMDTDPLHPRLVLAGSEGSDRASRALQDVNYLQLAPRAGAAYTLPDEKTVIRGGWGLFYSNMITIGGMSSMAINPPNHLRINRTTDARVPSIVLDEGFDANALSYSLARDVTLVSYDRDKRVPTAQQWNLNIQRQLPGTVAIDLGYNANRLVNDWRVIDGNPAPLGPGDINARRPFTSTVVPGTTDTITLSNVVRVQKDGWSQYHALQAKVEKRYAKGVSLLGSYVWSKTMALGAAGGGGNNPFQNPLDLVAERALADNDRPHYFVASGTYDLPFARDGIRSGGARGVVEAIFGAWTLSPILTMSSGSPLSLTVNGNPSNTGQTDRPNVVGDWHLENPTVNQWFNTAAFMANDRYTFGNAARNILRGPKLVNLDVALRKSFRVSQRFTADVRLESFNATNRPPLGNPNTQLGNPNFGRISSAGPGRSNQLSFRLQF